MMMQSRKALNRGRIIMACRSVRVHLTFIFINHLQNKNAQQSEYQNKE